MTIRYLNYNNIINVADTKIFALALSQTIMPTLETTANITEGDTRLSTIHHIVDSKQYTEAMSNSLLEINEISNQLPPSDISETIGKTYIATSECTSESRH